MFDQINNWQMERCGKFTASENWKLHTKGRAKDEYFGLPAKTYIKAKVAEILTLEPSNANRVSSYAMEWGNANEYAAVVRFEKETGLSVEYFGGGNPKFFNYTDFSGGSPDGLISDTHVIEVKCPFNSSEHYEHLLLETEEDLKDYAPAYYWQIKHNMLFTNRTEAYFISYDPRYAIDKYQIKVLPLTLTDEDTIEIKERIAEGEKMLSTMIGVLDSSILIATHDAELQTIVVERG